MTVHVGLTADVDETAMVATVQRELRRLDELPILTARTMTAQRDASIPRWAVRAAARMFGVFGTLALLIATIGVYGLQAYDVARRTRELGIRMALGATTGDITRLVLRKGLKTAVAGLALGLLLAVSIGRLVSSILLPVARSTRSPCSAPCRPRRRHTRSLLHSSPASHANGHSRCVEDGLGLYDGRGQ